MAKLEIKESTKIVVWGWIFLVSNDIVLIVGNLLKR